MFSACKLHEHFIQKMVCAPWFGGNTDKLIAHRLQMTHVCHNMAALTSVRSRIAENSGWVVSEPPRLHWIEGSRSGSDLSACGNHFNGDIAAVESPVVAEVLENRKDVMHVSGAEQRRLHRNRRGQFGALLGV